MKYSFPAFENGFIRAAAASPALRVADCTYNAEQIIGVIREYAAKNVQLLCLPEFALTGYTCSDLFLQDTLLRGAEEALAAILEASKGLNIVVLVGLPVRHNGKLYNCAAVLCNGELLGLVPKTHLPNYGEFYEKRHFIPGMHEPECITLAGQETLLGTNLLFACQQLPAYVLAAEVCEDLWAPIPPSCAHALAGATVVANLSASDETVGKAGYRRELVRGQSARLLCAYLYADAGHGESTTDMTFAGHNLIAENGSLLADAAPFAQEDAVTELDLGRMVQERQRNTTFMPETNGYTTVEFELPPVKLALTRPVSRTPFVPQDAATRAERCELILRIQAEGLAKRMEHTHAKCGVLGISGGLDSCLALLVAVRACKVLGRDAKDIVALTMPCFGTTKRTRSNAEILCEALGVTFGEINIAQTVQSHFADIGQPADKYDVTFENCQARVRTLELMDYANKNGGFVIGTGDLSELALGWATYNGDHMSMYGVNTGVPKTLVRHIVQYVADTCGNATLRDVLVDILDTPVSPELLPTAADGTIAQQTEKLVGPYELHDFYLYYVLRFGFSPTKIYHLARTAFDGKYEPEVLLAWLKNFYRRFFAQQFKRSCRQTAPRWARSRCPPAVIGVCPVTPAIPCGWQSFTSWTCNPDNKKPARNRFSRFRAGFLQLFNFSVQRIIGIQGVQHLQQFLLAQPRRQAQTAQQSAACLGAVGRAGDAPVIQVGVGYRACLGCFLPVCGAALQRRLQPLQNQLIRHALHTQQALLAGLGLAGLLAGNSRDIGLQNVFCPHQPGDKVAYLKARRIGIRQDDKPLRGGHTLEQLL